VIGLWRSLINKIHPGSQQKNSLSDNIWLHLVAFVEECGKKTTSRPSLYKITVPSETLHQLGSQVADLEKDLAARLTAEARIRGYPAGEVRLKITGGSVNSIQVGVASSLEIAAEVDNETTAVYQLTKRCQRAPLPRRQLIVLAGPQRGTIFALWEPKILVGRSETNHVVLYDEGVSRVHLRLVWAGNEDLLEDLGSLNGTWLNGRLIREQKPLRVGDKITLGSTVLEYRG